VKTGIGGTPSHPLVLQLISPSYIPAPRKIPIYPGQPPDPVAGMGDAGRCEISLPGDNGAEPHGSSPRDCFCRSQSVIARMKKTMQRIKSIHWMKSWSGTRMLSVSATTLETMLMAPNIHQRRNNPSLPPHASMRLGIYYLSEVTAVSHKARSRLIAGLEQMGGRNNLYLIEAPQCRNGRVDVITASFLFAQRYDESNLAAPLPPERGGFFFGGLDITETNCPGFGRGFFFTPAA